MDEDIRVELRNVIRDKGYIQAAIAKKAGLSPVKLSMILNLERRLEANELFEVCKVIEMTPNRIMLETIKKSHLSLSTQLLQQMVQPL